MRECGQKGAGHVRRMVKGAQDKRALIHWQWNLVFPSEPFLVRIFFRFFFRFFFVFFSNLRRGLVTQTMTSPQVRKRSGFSFLVLGSFFRLFAIIGYFGPWGGGDKKEEETVTSRITAQPAAPQRATPTSPTPKNNQQGQSQDVPFDHAFKSHIKKELTETAIFKQ